MWADEVLEHVRAVREAHAARFGYDIAAIVDDLRRREQAGGRRVVQPPTPPLEEVDPSSEDAPLGSEATEVVGVS